MFFDNRVAPKARYAYSCDAWSGIMVAVMMGLTMPFLGVIARDQLHASRLQLSVLTAAGVAPNLLAIFWAHIMEGRRKMPFATWPWVIGRSLFFLMIFAKTADSFVGIVVLYWLVTSVAGPAYSALMKEIYPDKDRGQIMAYARVCTTASSVVAILIAGPLLKVVSYCYVFPVAALFGFASAFAFNRIPSGEMSGDSSVPPHIFLWKSISILWEDHGYRWFCTGIFTLGAANLLAEPVLTAYRVDVLHFDTRWAALVTVITAIVQMRAYIYWGLRVDRRPSDEAAAIGAVMCGVIMFAYCFITEPWMILPLAVIQGVANAAVELAYLNGVLQYAPKDRITHYQAVFAFLMGVRGLVIPFPFIGSLLVKWHALTPTGVFAVSTVMIMLSAGIQVVGMRKHKPLAGAG